VASWESGSLMRELQGQSKEVGSREKGVGDEWDPDLGKFEARDDVLGGIPTKGIAGLSLPHTIQAKIRRGQGLVCSKLHTAQIIKNERG